MIIKLKDNFFIINHNIYILLTLIFKNKQKISIKIDPIYLNKFISLDISDELVK